MTTIFAAREYYVKCIMLEINIIWGTSLCDHIYVLHLPIKGVPYTTGR